MVGKKVLIKWFLMRKELLLAPNGVDCMSHWSSNRFRTRNLLTLLHYFCRQISMHRQSMNSHQVIAYSLLAVKLVVCKENIKINS